MSATSPSNEELARLAEAAEWVQALSRNRHDDKSVESWLEWCARDPRNQQAFEGLAKIWGASANLASASRALPRVTDSPLPARPRSRNIVFRALAASLLVVIGAAVLFWAVPRGSGDEAQSIVSPAGVRSTSELPDGSIMDLGGQTQVRLLYSSALRRVDMLDGELYVTVSKDKNRSFVVNAGALRVTAIGTAFNVRRDSDRTVVTVNEGSVDIARDADDSMSACATAGGCVRLTAGQQLAYANGAKDFQIQSVDPGIATAWRSGVLQFVDEPLSSVVASVNRYSPREITIRDKPLRALSFTGTVHPDRIDRWLSALENAFPLSVVESGENSVTLVARP